MLVICSSNKQQRQPTLTQQREMRHRKLITFHINNIEKEKNAVGIMMIIV